MGAVFSQKHGTEWMPLLYWSRRFNNSQMNYSPFDKELLALSMAIDHFRDFEGQIHTVRTDHKPLLGALKKSNDKFNAFQKRHFNTIAQFTNEVCYLEGRKYNIADALSKLNYDSYPNQVEDEEIEPLVDLSMVNDSIGAKKCTKVSIA